MTEWQPIETVPEQSEPFMVASDGAGCDAGWVGIGQREFLTAGDVKDWKWSAVRVQILQFVPPLLFKGEAGEEKLFAAEPSHWMLPPAPPKAK